MSLREYKLQGRWSGGGSNCEKVVAIRGSARFQLKRYLNFPFPAGADPSSERTKVKIARCKELLAKRRRLTGILKKADGGEGILAYATAVFLNPTLEAPGVIEAVPLVDGARDLDFVRADGDRINSAMIGCARCLFKLHTAKVVHADLKPENFLFVPVGASGRIIRVVLIDFDRSYETNDVPTQDDMGGSDGFIAPEVIHYVDDEDCSEDGRDSVYYGRLCSPARDIYSLGVLYHMMLTGAQPVAKDGRRRADRTAVKVEYLRDLLDAMLSEEPSDRPGIEDVLDTLTNGRISFSMEAYEALWPEHAARFTYGAKERFSRIRRLDDGGSHRYTVYYPSGEIRDFTIQMLVNLGVVRCAGSPEAPAANTFTEGGATYEEGKMWPEHADFMIDMDRLRQRGYTTFYRVARDGVHTYAVRRQSGTIESKSMLVLSFEKCLIKR